MAGQANNYGPIQSFIAGATVAQALCVKQDSTVNQVVVTTGITSDVVGISLNSVASGDANLEVLTARGTKVKVTASAAISLGDQVVPGANGKVATATAAGATAKSIGIALSACAADGELIEMLFLGGVNGPANT